jgi:hypothetical protein
MTTVTRPATHPAVRRTVLLVALAFLIMTKTALCGDGGDTGGGDWNVATAPVSQPFTAPDRHLCHWCVAR